MTPVLKFILAPIFLAAAWGGLLSALITGAYLGSILKRLLVSVVVTAFVWLSIKPIRRVQIGGGKIWVSNYFKEIGIPLEQVHTVYVSQGRYIDASIHLRQETEFGRVINFYPAGMKVMFNRNKWEREMREALKPSSRQKNLPDLNAK